MDVTIIGGGPAGLYAAFYSGLREMRTKIIEFQPKLGGKVHIYPEKMIWDVGGLPPLTGAKFIDQMVKQGLTFNPEVVLNEKASSISRNRDGTFVIRTKSGVEHYSKTVIIACGAGILQPQKLNINGAERFEISNLHYTVKSIQSFQHKTVLISGGGNSAIDWANTLEPVAKKVYMSYRKDKLNGHEAQISELTRHSVECLFQTTITNLIASSRGDLIEQVELTNHETGELSSIEVDEVVINHGFDRESSLLQNSTPAVQLLDDFFIDGSHQSESSVEGLYGAGDILKNDGKVHLIAGVFHDAVNAVNKAKQYIDPASHASGMVSSHNDRFKERNKKLLKELIR
nr:NAD(P)/FAD-dependent oxidoreductase [Shouchella shacheensis]